MFQFVINDVIPACEFTIYVNHVRLGGYEEAPCCRFSRYRRIIERGELSEEIRES